MSGDGASPVTQKSLGQHWLHDDTVLGSICDAAKLQPTDTVLEIGPGTGTLTRHLVKQAAKVVAVEVDSTLAARLATQEFATKLQIVREDILKFDLTGLPPDYKVVANIPYYLTSKLIRILSETPNRASTIVLLVQKEVAQRIAASPGQMSLLSVSAQFYWQVSLGEVVPARLFTPPPKVDSQVIVLHHRAEPLFPGVDTKRFFRLIKAGFASRRKTLLNSLAGGLRTEKEQIQQVLDTAEISSSLRPQALSLEDWHALYIASLAAGLL